MPPIYRSQEGERLVRHRYLTLLQSWPVDNEQIRVATREGETFVVASGDPATPPLLLFHGTACNSAMWMGDVAEWARYFRVYAVDLIGEPGLSAPARPPLDSEAHALWLDDVMEALSLRRASIVGVSLGGWLALDYATRRPECVESLVVLCPSGVGRQKIGILFKLLPLFLCGAWGRRKAAEIVVGRWPADPMPAFLSFQKLMTLVQENFRVRTVKIPVFSDAALKRLDMPVMAILGGKDVLLNSAETKTRLEQNVARVDIRYYPEAGHLLPGQTATILEFLRNAVALPTGRAAASASPSTRK